MLLFKNEQKVIAEIHNAFDTAEDRLLREAKQILNNAQGFVKGELAELAESIGFSNIPLVKQSKKIKKEIFITRSQAELIEGYKQKYPFQKFLTTAELDKICEKYDLIYAPIKNYKENVPEKNIKEIASATSLNSEDEQVRTITISDLNIEAKLLLDLLGKEKGDHTFSLKEMQELNSYWTSGNVGAYGLSTFEDALYNDNWFSIGGRHYLIKHGYRDASYPEYSSKQVVDKQGLFIAAPQSHFDLKDLSKKGRFGFLKIFDIPVKDPIVFRYCRGGIQVLSKWGLEASDELVVNEKMN